MWSCLCVLARVLASLRGPNAPRVRLRAPHSRVSSLRSDRTQDGEKKSSGPCWTKLGFYLPGVTLGFKGKRSQDLGIYWHLHPISKVKKKKTFNGRLFNLINLSRREIKRKNARNEHQCLDNLPCDFTVGRRLGLMMSECEQHDEEGCRRIAWYAVRC